MMPSIKTLKNPFAKQKLEFPESDVLPGKTKVKESKFIEFISQEEGLFQRNV